MKNTPKPPTKTAKFIYVPKNKGESSNKGDADLNSISDHPNCLSIVKEPSATNKFLEFSAGSNNYHPRRSYRLNLAQTLIKT